MKNGSMTIFNEENHRLTLVNHRS